jgi:glycosyltransferase involved in cell wall biosynthesis
VVLPAHGAFPELIEATGAGLLVAPESITELADALARVLNDHTFRYRAGLAGEAAVRERFSAEVMARETVALIERVTRTSRSPAIA